MELTMSMFATQADYWKARAELAESTVKELALELCCEPDNEVMLAEVSRLRGVMQYDMSKVIGLTHSKAKDIIARRCYAVTGFVLTDETGRKCIVDMSAVRWFDEQINFHRMMHPN